MIRFVLLMVFLGIYCDNCVAQKEYDIFLLMGQSNMAGYGDIKPEDKETTEGVYMLRDSVGLGFTWVSASQPIHNRLTSDRFCLAGSFSKVYKQMYPETNVGLLPMAWGGASIKQMQKGTPFYEEVIEKALWAKRSGRLKAILWHQGESDTELLEDAMLYESRLKQLITDLRKDLQEPTLLVLIGDLAPFYGEYKEHSSAIRKDQIKIVRKSLRNVANTMPFVRFVSSKDLHSYDHYQVHFDRESTIILGIRYFDAYWSFFNQGKL